MIDWIKKMLKTEKPITSATYREKEVVVYSITEYYAIISYNVDGIGMFSVSTNELKNLK